MKRKRIYLAGIAALLLMILILSCVRLFKNDAANCPEKFKRPSGKLPLAKKEKPI